MTTGFWIFLIVVLAATWAAFYTPRISLATILNIALVSAIAMLAVLALKILNQPSAEQATRVSCINNLRQIDSAKEQWALEKEIVTAAPVDQSAVDQFIKGGRPKCFGNGAYEYGKIGVAPTCSLPSHKLPPLGAR